MTTQLIKHDSDADDLVGTLLDPARVFNAIWLRKWIILALSSAMSLAAFLWVGAKPASYRADATMLIEMASFNPLMFQDLMYGGYVGFEYMETQFELLRSRSVAERVVRKLALHRMERFRPQPPPPDPWYKFDLSMLKPAGFNPAPEQPWTMPSEESQIQSLTNMVAGRLQVEQLGGSNMVMVSFTADDPRLAASITNTYLQEYIESHLDARMASTLQATDWLTERLADLRENLKRSEERLQAFRDQEQLVDLQGVATLSTQEITNLNNTFSQSRQRRLELEATREELQRIGDDGTVEELLTIPAVFNHDAIRNLRQAERDAQRAVSELSRRYGPKHPKMIEAVTRLDTARTALELEVRNVTYGIEREYQVALNAETTSKQQLDATRLDLQDLNRKEFLLREYEREVETNTQLYDIFFTRLRETDETGEFEAPPARIIDLAADGYRIGPNVQRAAMLAFAMSFMALCGLAVLLDALDNTIKTPADVEEKLGLPLLGALPLLKAAKGEVAEEYWDNQTGTFAEAVRTIRTAVVLSNIDKPAKVIVVTSSVPGEGKSTLALNLATAFSQLEKTILIGADMRRPTLAKRCNLSPKHPGLSNYVAGSAEFDACIAQFNETALTVMPAGLIPSNPLELLSSNRFRETLDLLKTRYDRIIVDSAPVAAVSDALMLASYADSLLFVVKADDTATTVVQKSVRQLLAANEPLTGVILTHYDPSKATKYYGEYRYKYGYYNSGHYHSNETHG